MHDDTNAVAGHLIREIRAASGLSQTELALRSDTQGSVLSAYERGRRQPGVASLARIAAAAGFELRVAPAPDHKALEQAGRVLSEVLELAERMPSKTRGKLDYPALTRLNR